jgi:hypothetical protein
MHLRLGSTAIMALLIGALVDVAPAAAQGRAPERETAGTTGTVEPQIDVYKLGVDISRIRRQLIRYTVSEERDGMNLRYLVGVFGSAPAIDIFPAARFDPNFFKGPVPYGAPTHRDFLSLNTPKEHRAPAADLGSAFRWLTDKATGEKNTPKR